MRLHLNLFYAKVIGLFLILGSIGCSTCHREKEEVPRSSLEIRQYAISNSCRITCGQSSGSGILATENIALTANHVISDYLYGSIVGVEIPGDQISTNWEVVYSSSVYDLAIIRRPSSKGPGRRRWVGWSPSLTIGQRVYASGYPWGIGPILTSGYLSRISGDYFWISANALPGSSGSAIYGSDGKVIGILVRGFVRGGDWSQFTFHAIPVSLLAGELSKLGVK